MSAHTVDEILAASAAWVWFPRDSENGREHLLLVRDPERFGGGVRGSQVESSLSPQPRGGGRSCAGADESVGRAAIHILDELRRPP